MHHIIISPKWDVRLMLFKILVKATQANKRSKTPKQLPARSSPSPISVKLNKEKINEAWDKKIIGIKCIS